MRDRLLPAVMLMIMAATAPALAGPPTEVLAALDQADAESTQTAAVMPGIGRGARIAPVPQPLTAADSQTYGRILKLQDEGQWAAADRELGRLKDDGLKGIMLARRYLSPGYHPKYPELRAWMAQFSDLPQAEAIYRLAMTKGIKGPGAIKPPVGGALRGTGIDNSDDGANWETSTFRTDRGSAAAKSVKAHFRQLLRKGDKTAAIALFNGKSGGLAEVDVDEMKLALALDHFAGGRDEPAVKWAEEAAERSGDELPAAHWIAGLAQWRLHQLEEARVHFEQVANATDSSGWMVSAGAFWAARANLLSERPEVVNHWLEIAASYPRTFYGLLARRILGYDTQFSWDSAPFTEADADLLMRVPGGRRALALLQLGEHQAAEEELRKLYPRTGKAVRQSMLALAQTAELPGLAVRLGAMASGAGDAASFPIPDWNPKGGWQVEKALVLAIVRQESAFNTRARSKKGAGGLMQVMPATAAAIAGRQGRAQLNDPENNLALGQHYLAHLMNEEPVNGNLLFLAAAYNAGPGRLGQWLATVQHNDDPLLFIEALPSRETRAFVERVMTNYWIYRARLDQSAESLDLIAAGTWPTYEGEDTGKVRLRKAGTR